MFVACSRDDSDKSVIVTIPPLQGLVSDIAGDRIKVESLMESSVNPETFSPTVAQLVDINLNGALLTVGTLPAEEKLIADDTNIKVFNMSDGVKLLKGTHGDCANHRHHDEYEHDQDGVDPHIWSSPRALRTMADNATRALIDIDPDNAKYYRHRGDSIMDMLDKLSHNIATRLAPYRGDTILVYHPSLSYYAEEFGLVQTALEENGKESSVAGRRKRFDGARHGVVRAFFYQTEFDPARASTISETTGLEVTLINPMDRDYLKQIKIITDAIDTPRLLPATDQP